MDPGKRTFYLGRYNCIEQLGTGPIGETYLAKIYGVAGFEKQFAVKPMPPEEAVLQLELIGHDFFVFRDADSNDVKVVYRRRDGDYGLIEPQ